MTYIAEKQALMEPGFQDFNGNIWVEADINRYNQHTADINQSAGRPIKSGSLLDREREHRLNCRHQFFVRVCSGREREGGLVGNSKIKRKLTLTER